MMSSETLSEMKIGLVIASHGRPAILQQVMTHLLLQRRIPDEIVISAVGHDDISAADRHFQGTNGVRRRRPHVSAK